MIAGISLALQWEAGGVGSITSWGTKIPRASRCGQKKKKVATLKKRPRFREYPQGEGAERTVQQIGSREREPGGSKEQSVCESAPRGQGWGRETYRLQERGGELPGGAAGLYPSGNREPGNVGAPRLYEKN